FQVTGGYDSSRELVVDPSISFTSLLGGSGDDKVYGLAVDASGNACIAGLTASTNFPTANGYQSSRQGFQSAFAARFSPDGKTLIYSTYLGGNVFNNQQGAASSAAAAIALDGAGSVYLTGQTDASDFPVTAGAYKTSIPDVGMVGFLTKLNATGD